MVFQSEELSRTLKYSVEIETKYATAATIKVRSCYMCFRKDAGFIFFTKLKKVRVSLVTK
jgi:hypothetical protein